MSVEVQHRRDAWADVKTVTPAAGELGYITDLKTATMGDGSKLGGHMLAKWGKRYVVEPAEITGDVDDYAPTNSDIAEVLVLTSDDDWAITGLAGGAADRTLTLVNRGDHRITLPDQSSASTAQNRFDFGFALVLRPNQAVTVFYDATASRWAIAHLGLFSVSDIPESLSLSGILSPSQITATQDDYAPAGGDLAAVWRLTSDASRNITGIVPHAIDPDGDIKVIVNSGASPIVLQNANSNSTTANRFDFGGDVTLAAKQVAVIWYDATSSRWRLLSGPPTAGASDVPADLSLLLGQLALAVADNANVAQFLGDTGNRFADSFDALTYVDTGAATNLDTGSAGMLKPNSDAGGSETSATPGADAGNAGYTFVDRAWAVDNNRRVSHVGVHSTVAQTFVVKLLKRNSLGNYDVVVSESLSHGGTGWEDKTLSSIYNVPASGSYYAGVYSASNFPTQNASVVSSYSNSNVTGTGQSLTEATGKCPGVRVTYAAYADNVTVSSTALTAASAPSSAKLIARVKETDAITLNTDLVFSVSRDGGTTWTAFAMTKKFTANSIAVYESDNLDISAQPSGTSMKWRVVSANSKNFEIRDIYIYWT